MCKYINSSAVTVSFLSLVFVVLLFGALTAIAQTSGKTTTTPSPTTPQILSVSVVNTPNVNIANIPSITLASGAMVSLAGTPNVRITNTAASPLLVRDIDNPARNPFTFYDRGAFNNNASDLSRSFVVPSGKRLVVEQLSVLGTLARSSSQMMLARLYNFTTTGSTASSLAVVGIDTHSGFFFGAFYDIFVASSQARFYADAGNTVFIEVDRSDTTTGATADTAEVSLSGYLIDMP